MIGESYAAASPSSRHHSLFRGTMHVNRQMQKVVLERNKARQEVSGEGPDPCLRVVADW